MCIFIDKNIYREDITDTEKNTVFEYLYHLAKMLSVKGRFFNRSHYYEDFALYVASELFMRLTNQKQFEYDSDGNPKMEKIRSVLNYMKGILVCKKITFESEFYSQILSKDDVIETHPEYTFQSVLKDSVDELELIEFDACLRDACKTIRNFLSRIPFKNDRIMMQNIYISCLLSFLNSITLSHSDVRKIKDTKTVSIADGLIDECFAKENVDFSLTYHLPKNMKSYIHVLTKEAKHAVAKDISIDSHCCVTSNTGFEALTLHELNI